MVHALKWPLVLQACTPWSWTRRGHLAAKKTYEITRELQARNATFCTARLFTIFSSRRTHIVTLFFA
jgi:hypothetical protein